MTKLTFAVWILSIQIGALALQLLGWLVQYFYAHPDEEHEIPLSGVAFVGASEVGFAALLKNIQRRRTMAKARGSFTDADMAFLRKFNMVYCVQNATGSAILAYSEQTVQQFFIALAAT